MNVLLCDGDIIPDIKTKNGVNSVHSYSCSGSLYVHDIEVNNDQNDELINNELFMYGFAIVLMFWALGKGIEAILNILKRG